MVWTTSRRSSWSRATKTSTSSLAHAAGSRVRGRGGGPADAIGELADIVGGSVKSCVDGQSSLSLPNVSRYALGAAGPDAT